LLRQRSTDISSLWLPGRLLRRGHPRDVDDRFSLVFVCSGNRFRSPLAAALLRQLAHDLPVDVASVGTLRLDGVPPLSEAHAIGSEWGVDLSGHRSSVLRPSAVAAADLILGFEQFHVRHAVVDGSAAESRTFTFGEFVRLLGEISEPAGGTTVVERARLRVAAAHDARGGVLGRLNTDELVDPFGRRGYYRAVGDELRRLSCELAVGLFEVEPSLAAPGIGRQSGA
jgi:protein-tyrosine-phosphatase